MTASAQKQSEKTNSCTCFTAELPAKKTAAFPPSANAAAEYYKPTNQN